MKILYCVEQEEELRSLRKYYEANQTKIEAYLDYLAREFQVTDLPKSLVLTNKEIATSLVSNIPLPAYTNDFRIVFAPQLEAWRELYSMQLDSVEDQETNLTSIAEIRDYYKNNISENHVLQILGHELAHHSELFFEDERSCGIWFEEGMVEYISRKYFLTEKEFEAEKKIQREIVALFKDQYGRHSLENFGASTYAGDIASILFEYWRSYLAIEQILEEHGDISLVFESYHQWHEQSQDKTLAQWFGIE